MNFTVHLISILQKKKLKFLKAKQFSQGHTAIEANVELELKSLDWSPDSVQPVRIQHAYVSDEATIL